MIFSEVENFKAYNFTFLNKITIDLSVLEIFLYADILIGIFTMIYFSIYYLKTKKNILTSLLKKSDPLTWILLSIAIFSSICKSFLASKFLPSEIGFFDLIVPLGTWVLGLIFFKKEKPTQRQLVSFLICFVGIAIYTLSKSQVIFSFKIPLFLYFIIKSISSIGERRLSKNRNLNEAFSIDNIAYAILGICILFFFECKDIGYISIKAFNVKYIFTLPVIIVFALSILSHLFTILAHKQEKSITGFLIKSIVAIILNISLTYLFFNKIINIYQFVGIVIIMLGFYFLNKK